VQSRDDEPNMRGPDSEVLDVGRGWTSRNPKTADPANEGHVKCIPSRSLIIKQMTQRVDTIEPSISIYKYTIKSNLHQITVRWCSWLSRQSNINVRITEGLQFKSGSNHSFLPQCPSVDEVVFALLFFITHSVTSSEVGS
jgi:hypothetical protein